MGGKQLYATFVIHMNNVRTFRHRDGKSAAVDKSRIREDFAELRLQGSVRAENRLLLICDQLLDEDIQPSADDFELLHGNDRFAVVAVQLESPWSEQPARSALVLLTECTLPKSDKLTVIYRPIQWRMWSSVHDKSIAPFEWQLQSDKSLAKVAVPEIAPPPVVAPVEPRAQKKAEMAPHDQAPLAPDLLARLKAPLVASHQPLLDRLLAVSALLAVSVGGFLVAMLIYLGVQLFGGDAFESAQAKNCCRDLQQVVQRWWPV
jgi:hypothetical protein